MKSESKHPGSGGTVPRSLRIGVCAVLSNANSDTSVYEESPSDDIPRMRLSVKDDTTPITLTVVGGDGDDTRNITVHTADEIDIGIEGQSETSRYISSVVDDVLCGYDTSVLVLGNRSTTLCFGELRDPDNSADDEQITTGVFPTLGIELFERFSSIPSDLARRDKSSTGMNVMAVEFADSLVSGAGDVFDLFSERTFALSSPSEYAGILSGATSLPICTVNDVNDAIGVALLNRRTLTSHICVRVRIALPWCTVNCDMISCGLMSNPQPPNPLSTMEVLKAHLVDCVEASTSIIEPHSILKKSSKPTVSTKSKLKPSSRKSSPLTDLLDHYIYSDIMMIRAVYANDATSVADYQSKTFVTILDAISRLPNREAKAAPVDSVDPRTLLKMSGSYYGKSSRSPSSPSSSLRVQTPVSAIASQALMKSRVLRDEVTAVGRKELSRMRAELDQSKVKHEQELDEYKKLLAKEREQRLSLQTKLDKLKIDMITKENEITDRDKALTRLESSMTSQLDGMSRIVLCRMISYHSY